MLTLPIARVIIPISKLLGNYNNDYMHKKLGFIIPISKLLGNYNRDFTDSNGKVIIPISKLLGNYNIVVPFMVM